MPSLQRSKRFLPALYFALIAAVLGVVLLLLTKAAAPNVVLESESGTVAAPAATFDDVTASGQKYVQFGGSSFKPNFFGVTTHPIWQPTDYQATSIALMKEAGVKAVRLGLPWNSMEATKGTFHPTYLSRIDYAVNNLTANGIEPLLIVLNSPQWASGSADPHMPPINNSDYNTYLTFWINRYKGKVKYYEIWNEPDGRWAWTNPDPVRYTSLLKSAYTAAKAADPSIVILGGSQSGTGTPQQTYLRAMYAQGAKGYFDILSQHGYGDPPSHGNTTPEVTLDSFTTNILPILQANGEGNKRVWWTETGYNTYTTGGGVSEAVQADYLTRAYKKAATLANVDRLYYYEWTYDRANTTSTNIEDFYGLLDPYSTPAWRKKPAFGAFKALANP